MGKKEILRILRLDGYSDAANWIEDLQAALELTANQINRDAELKYLRQFAFESCFDTEVCRDQLRSLWTAYCFHHNLDVDTADYDQDLRVVWEAAAEVERETADWSNFDSFDQFMCRELV